MVFKKMYLMLVNCSSFCCCCNNVMLWTYQLRMLSENFMGLLFFNLLMRWSCKHAYVLQSCAKVRHKKGERGKFSFFLLWFH